MTLSTERLTPRAAGALQHEALFYDSERSYLDGVVPFLRGALEVGEAAFVAVPPAKLELIRDRLGSAAGSVAFADMSQLGRNPGRIIPAIRQFVDDHAGRATRFVGEPAWAGRTPSELVEATRHEALINLAFEQSPVTILCPYDVTGLDSGVLADAHRTHPTIVGAGGHRASAGYADPVEVARPDSWPLPPPPSDLETIVLDDSDLVVVRRAVRRFALGAGLSPARTDDLLLALNELVTNTFVHAGGHGVVRVWLDVDTIVCEVQDAGHIADPLAGRRLPPAGAEGGRGLWLVNQLSDLLQLRSSAAGTTSRVHIWRGPATSG